MIRTAKISGKKTRAMGLLFGTCALEFVPAVLASKGKGFSVAHQILRKLGRIPAPPVLHL